MDWLHLPDRCIQNKEIPLYKIMDRLRRQSEPRYAQLSPAIASCHVYACLKPLTYPLDCPKDQDGYLNEIVFIHVILKQHIDMDYFTRHLLRLFMYQAVIVYQLGEEYSFASGPARDSKTRPGSRKVVQYFISRWISGDELNVSGRLDISRMNHSGYAELYDSIFEAIKWINKDRYITLSFAADLYSYTHGGDLEKYWPAQLKLHDMIKQRYPYNRFKTKEGTEIYRFSEDEVFELISLNQGYVTGDDLVETLHNFCEFEEDFTLKLPEQLDDKVQAYAEDIYNGFVKSMEDDESETDHEDWLDDQDDFDCYKPIALYEYEPV